MLKNKKRKLGYVSVLVAGSLMLSVIGTSTKAYAKHSHSYSAATCTSPATCSCGATKGSALGHQLSAATCTTAERCNRCYQTFAPATGHSWSSASASGVQYCTKYGCHASRTVSAPAHQHVAGQVAVHKDNCGCGHD